MIKSVLRENVHKITDIILEVEMVEKYEYRVIAFDKASRVTDVRPGEDVETARKRFEDWLNKYGEQGWELVGKGDLCYVFKKRK
jgi:transposase